MIGPIRWPSGSRRPRPAKEDEDWFFEEDEDVETIKEQFHRHNKGDLTSYEALTDRDRDEKV